jgi:hypothetical protein
VHENQFLKTICGRSYFYSKRSISLNAVNFSNVFTASLCPDLVRQGQVLRPCARRGTRAVNPHGTSVWHPSPKMRVSTVCPEAGKEAGHVAVSSLRKLSSRGTAVACSNRCFWPPGSFRGPGGASSTPYGPRGDTYLYGTPPAIRGFAERQRQQLP